MEKPKSSKLTRKLHDDTQYDVKFRYTKKSDGDLFSMINNNARPSTSNRVNFYPNVQNIKL